jgi:hypothetical protein
MIQARAPSADSSDFTYLDVSSYLKPTLLVSRDFQLLKLEKRDIIYLFGCFMPFCLYDVSRLEIGGVRSGIVPFLLFGERGSGGTSCSI